MKRIKTICVLFVCMQLTLHANVLDDYIQTGLKQNFTLQKKNFSLQKSLSALAEARGMFLPSISLEARYTRADGGRVIDIPVGDLMNPIYQILQSSVRLENESIPFLREEEHETKVRFVQPVFQPKLYYNYKIKQEFRDIRVLDKDIYTRHLVNDIQSAYYQYLKSEQLIDLLDKTYGLLKENVRVSNSLFKNDKVTRDAVYRAKAELLALEEMQAEANKNCMLAKSYFNFLLNRALQEEIENTEMTVPDRFHLDPLDVVVNQSIANREELKQIEEAIEISEHQKGIAKSGYLPGISAVVDYGYQGEKYKIDDQHNYWMASVVASWNLFNGFQDHHKIQQAKLTTREYESQFNALKVQVQLQTQEAYYNVDVAWKKIQTTKERENAAAKSFEIVNRKYREGMAPQIEYIEARNEMTQAQVNAIVAQYDFLIKKAELERVTAVYPVKRGKE